MNDLTFLTLGALVVDCFQSLPSLVGAPTIGMVLVDVKYGPAGPGNRGDQ